jgi:hypothetical protein
MGAMRDAYKIFVGSLMGINLEELGTQSGQGPMVDSCEHSNKPFDSVKDGCKIWTNTQMLFPHLHSASVIVYLLRLRSFLFMRLFLQGHSEDCFLFSCINRNFKIYT